MATILLELFIETTLRRLDELEERLQNTETKLQNHLIDLQMIEMSTPQKD